MDMKKQLRRYLVSQFARPRGFLGHLAGTIMANRTSNQERNRWTISLLEVKPDDRVLEIGFGPGFAMHCVSEMVSEGYIAGVDHSAAMLRQASWRNVGAIKKGIMDLKQGSVEELPTFSAPFHKIFSANVVQFWSDPVQGFNNLKSLLVPGGRIATTFQPRNQNATDHDTQKMGQKIVSQLKEAGFQNIRLETKKMNPVSVVCVLAEK